MHLIRAENVSLILPIYSTGQRSIRRSLVDLTVGGKLGFDRRNRMTVQALGDVSFEIGEGERVGIVGHNGAGKSMLLKTMAGIFLPTSGTMTVEGSINTLFDISLGFDMQATGLQNIYYRGYLMGLKRAEIDALVDWIVDFAELGVFLDAPLNSYSSGMSLRLAFAVSTAFERDILLMDEWVAVGDAQFQTKAEAHLQELARQSRIVVLASHSEPLLRQLCTSLLLLHHGALIVAGPVDEVLATYAQLGAAQETASGGGSGLVSNETVERGDPRPPVIAADG